MYVINSFISPNSLLDLYPGAAMAFSMRKLRAAYTGNCVRLRRASDNAEADFGFDSDGGIDQTGIVDWAAGANAFVVKWYDQSPNANDLTQSTAVRQPQLVSLGAILTVNGKPAVKWDGVDDQMVLGVTPTATVPWTCFQVAKRSAAGSVGMWLSDGTGFQIATSGPYTDNFEYTQGNEGYIRSVATFTSAEQVLRSSVWNAGRKEQYRNGAFIASNFFTAAKLLSFAGFYNNSGSNQEFVFYSSDVSGNRIAIENNINAYWTIY